MKKLIAVAGNYFAITAALEYIVRALKRRDDIQVLTIGPYYGNNMPWNGGMLVKEEYTFKPDIKLPPNTPNIPVSYVENQCFMEFNKQPDIILDVNAGFYTVGKPQKAIHILFETDPHVLRGLYDKTAGDYKLIFNPQKSYMKDGEIYLPYGADIEWHSPIDPKPEKEYHISLIGNIYANRVALFQYLSDKCSVYFRLGIGKEDAREIYNKSIIGVNWSSMLDITARCFELAGIQHCVPMYNRVPYLDEIFTEDKQYVGFSDKGEFLEKADAILTNPAKYEHIGAEARRNLLENKHTWDDRVKTILERVGI